MNHACSATATSASSCCRHAPDNNTQNADADADADDDAADDADADDDDADDAAAADDDDIVVAVAALANPKKVFRLVFLSSKKLDFKTSSSVSLSFAIDFHKSSLLSTILMNGL